MIRALTSCPEYLSERFPTGGRKNSRDKKGVPRKSDVFERSRGLRINTEAGKSLPRFYVRPLNSGIVLLRHNGVIGTTRSPQRDGLIRDAIE